MNIDRSVRIRLNARMMPYLIGLLLVVQLIAPNRLWVILLVGLGGAFLIAWIWARKLAQGINLQREMRYGWVQVGDALEERFTLTNSGIFPAISAEVQDQSTLPDYAANQVRGVGSYATTRWVIKTVCSQRGLYEIGPSRLCMGDPLGIFTVEIGWEARTSLLVTPPVVPLPEIRVSSGGRSGDGRPRPNSQEITVSVGGVREYHPEDALRWIHWPTSARKNDLFVRVFDGTPAGDWWVLLDANEKSIFGSGKQSTLEHAVILAASLAAGGLQQGLAVGMLASGAPMTWLPPLPGESQQWDIFRNLALLEPSGNALGQTLKHMISTLKNRTSLVLITADTSGHWIEDLLPLMWRGIVPTVILLDPVSFGGSKSANQLVSTLTDWSVTHYLIGRDYLDQPDLQPGTEGHWEWRITATGKAIPMQQPQDQAWRELS